MAEPGRARTAGVEPGRTSTSSPAFRWLRFLVTGALIAWIVAAVDWGQFWLTVRATDPFYLGLSLLVSPVLVLVSAWKWRILLAALSLPTTLAACFRLYLVGIFFNNFLPTHVGGDAMRGIILGRQKGDAPAVMASVVAERVLGLVALLGAALLVVGWDRGRVFPAALLIGVLVATAVLGAAVALILSPGILQRVRGKAHLPFVGKLVRFQEAFQRFGRQRRALAACLALSLLFYALACANVYVTARAFGAPLGPVEAVVATPLILVIMLFPISVGGIGLAEGAYIFVLGQYGVTPAAALSTALLMRMKALALGLSGGLAYMAARSGGARDLVATAEPPASAVPRK